MIIFMSLWHDLHLRKNLFWVQQHIFNPNSYVTIMSETKNNLAIEFLVCWLGDTAAQLWYHQISYWAQTPLNEDFPWLWDWRNCQTERTKEWGAQIYRGLRVTSYPWHFFRHRVNWSTALKNSALDCLSTDWFAG